MTKKSRDRRKAYRSNKKYYLKLIKDFNRKFPFKMPQQELLVVRGKGVYFFSEGKDDLPRFIDIENEQEVKANFEAYRDAKTDTETYLKTITYHGRN